MAEIKERGFINASEIEGRKTLVTTDPLISLFNTSRFEYSVHIPRNAAYVVSILLLLSLSLKKTRPKSGALAEGRNFAEISASKKYRPDPFPGRSKSTVECVWLSAFLGPNLEPASPGYVSGQNFYARYWRTFITRYLPCEIGQS